MKKLLYLFIVSGILLCACRHTDSTALLRQADAVVYGNADSAMKLLSLIKNPERLPFEEKMLYGWLRTFAHNVRGASMAEDSLILPAFHYFVCRSGHGKDAEFIRAEIQIFILAEKA